VPEAERIDRLDGRSGRKTAHAGVIHRFRCSWRRWRDDRYGVGLTSVEKAERRNVPGQMIGGGLAIGGEGRIRRDRI